MQPELVEGDALTLRQAQGKLSRREILFTFRGLWSWVKWELLYNSLVPIVVILEEKKMSEATKSQSMSTGQKVWSWTAIVVSVIVLILSAAGVIGVWVGRSVAINVNNGLMDGVIQLSSVGEEASNRLSTRFGELSSGVGEIEAAVDEVAQNVSDKGVVMTLLPPEKEQKLVSTADNIAETVNTIVASLESAIELYKSINSIPFVNLPKPKEETVQELGSGVKEIQDSVDQLATDIQDFRDGAASEVSRISNAAGEVSSRLETSENNLVALESEMNNLQTRAEDFKGRFSTMVTILTVVVSLLLIWVVYAMVIVIRKYLDDLNG